MGRTAGKQGLQGSRTQMWVCPFCGPNEGQDIWPRTGWGACVALGAALSAPLRASSWGRDPMGCWRAVLFWALSFPSAPDVLKSPPNPKSLASVCVWTELLKP